MEYTIKDVYEFKGQLRVLVESEYGEDNIGLSLKSKYLGDDGQPRWMSEVKELMEKKYGGQQKDKSLPKIQVFKEHIGKKVKI